MPGRCPLPDGTWPTTPARIAATELGGIAILSAQTHGRSSGIADHPSHGVPVTSTVDLDTTSDITNLMTRRADGELERDVLRALWDLDRPAAPSEVIAEMKTDLAYTSIATVLGRLCDKGLVTRERAGRAYVYIAAGNEADLTADRIRSVLDSVSDRQSALAGFAQSLDPDDLVQLAELLKEPR